MLGHILAAHARVGPAHHRVTAHDDAGVPLDVAGQPRVLAPALAEHDPPRADAVADLEARRARRLDRRRPPLLERPLDGGEASRGRPRRRHTALGGGLDTIVDIRLRERAAQARGWRSSVCNQRR